MEKKAKKSTKTTKSSDKMSASTHQSMPAHSEQNKEHMHGENCC